MSRLRVSEGEESSSFNNSSRIVCVCMEGGASIRVMEPMRAPPFTHIHTYTHPHRCLLELNVCVCVRERDMTTWDKEQLSNPALTDTHMY